MIPHIRYDIAFAHMVRAKLLLRYLKGNPDLMITYKAGDVKLSRLRDSSFEMDPDKRRSTTGYTFFLSRVRVF